MKSDMNFSQIVFVSSEKGKGISDLIQRSNLIGEMVCLSFGWPFNCKRTSILFQDAAFNFSYAKKLSDSKTDYFIFTDGRCFAEINNTILNEILTQSTADIVAVNADSRLSAYIENPKLTSDDTIAGFCRLYENVSLKNPSLSVNPNYLFVKVDRLENILNGDTVSGFEDLVRLCSNGDTKVDSFNVAGTVRDISSHGGAYNFLVSNFDKVYTPLKKKIKSQRCGSTKISGNVFIESGAKIGDGAILIGPSIICANSTIGENSLIHSSIVMPDAKLSAASFFKNKIVSDGGSKGSHDDKIKFAAINSYSGKGFKSFSRWCYPILGKRIFDIIFSSVMIILFAPVIPLIVIAIKVNSPGPVFFKGKRQGLYGKDFNCLKFRTMIVGADGIQKTLRIRNEVDGPQFKMADDPRISSVGAFMRDTSLDEIPQFFNVLFGQMSIVGPRPSPAMENLKCPYWRDARLSVKPGLTGLWQIKRTRQPLRDFQEWVHYDTEYVSNMSFKFDLWICWKTALLLIRDFFNKF